MPVSLHVLIPLRLFDLYGRLVEVGGEDPMWDGFSPRRFGRKFIDLNVEVSVVVMQFKAFEFLFQLSHLTIVCTHSRGAWLHRLHDLVDDQLRVALDQESPRPHFDGNPEPIDEGLILGDIVGGIEVEADGITEFMPLRRRENNPAPLLVFK